MNAKQLIRLMKIDAELSSAEPISTEQLYNLFNGKVTIRTIENDLKALREGFKKEIERKGNKYQYKDTVNTVFNKSLALTEKRFLLELMYRTGGFDASFSELDNLKKRLESDLSRAGISKAGKSQIMLFHSNTNYTGLRHISTLYNYILDKKAVDIKYRKFNTDEEKTHTVFPYFLKEYLNRWFLICKPVPQTTDDYLDDSSKRCISLALDRITEIKKATSLTVNYQPEPADLRTRYDHIIGITYYDDSETGPKQYEDIVFAIEPHVSPYVETKPMCNSQEKLSGQELEDLRKLYPQLPGWDYYRLRSIQCNPELIQSMVSFYSNVVVISPEHLRQEMTMKTSKLAELYSSISPSNQ